MWSIGCVMVELYIGRPLFSAANEYELLYQVQSLLGPFPYDSFKNSKYIEKYAKFTSKSPPPQESEFVFLKVPYLVVI